MLFVPTLLCMTVDFQNFSSRTGSVCLEELPPTFPTGSIWNSSPSLAEPTNAMTARVVLLLLVAVAAVDVVSADFVYVAAKCRDVNFSLPGDGKVDLTCKDDAGADVSDAMLREESSDRHEVFLKFASETSAKRRLTIGKCIDPQVTKLTVNGYGDTTVSFLPDALNGLKSLSLLALGQLDPKDARIKLQVSAKLSYLELQETSATDLSLEMIPDIESNLTEFYGRGTKFPTLPTFLFERKYKPLKLRYLTIVPTPDLAIKKLNSVEYANARANFDPYTDPATNIANVTSEYKNAKIATFIQFTDDCKLATPAAHTGRLIVCRDANLTAAPTTAPVKTEGAPMPTNGSQTRVPIIDEAQVKQSAAWRPSLSSPLLWIAGLVAAMLLL
ncbi:hypothetical protein PINS_up015144 [Pythium insidiosum]|nr:hypothetical protein PINS_up015144 [Pythium insidiosum]